MSVYLCCRVRVGQLPAGGETGEPVRHEAQAASQPAGVRQGVHRPHAHRGLDQVRRMGSAANNAF